MTDSIFMKANRIIRKSRPAYLTNQICSEYYSANSLEIAFLSKRCFNDIKGSCIMCDYGYSKISHTDREYIEEMKRILNSHQNVKSLLLCTNGSFLNELQISHDLFIKILNVAAESDVDDIQIETHYGDINKEKLETIKSICKDKIVTIELGFETANQDYQDTIIMKHIAIDEIENTIHQVQSFGYKVILNIMLGLPFLSVKEQLLDTYKAILWGFNHNCRVVIFPINIKPYTLLWYMSKTGFYEPISHWSLIYLLSKFETEDLSNITIAWYGDRDEGDETSEESTIFPSSCNICNQKLMDFYKAFNEAIDSKKRDKLLQNILNETNACNCFYDFKKKYYSENDNKFNLKYKNCVKKIKEDYNI